MHPKAHRERQRYRERDREREVGIDGQMVARGPTERQLILISPRCAQRCVEQLLLIEAGREG